MTANIRTLAWALALAVLGGCAPSSPRPEPPAPADELSREAAALHARCTAARGTTPMDCYNAAFLAKMRQEGIPAAMHLLERLSAIDDGVKREGHMYAHSLGLASYSGAEKVGTTFRQCLPTFQSGCYHGVIQAYFADKAGNGGADSLTADEVNDLCRDYRNSPDGNWLLFQCVHGMGHGLAMVSNHDLKKTLGRCDLLRSGWEREGCYGGAFMENIMEAISPHHAVGRPGEAEHAGGMGEMAGMDMGGMEMGGMDHMEHMEHMNHGAASTAPPAKLIDPADPLYPCSALPDRYLHACYQMQTSVILNFNHANFAAAARTCDRVSNRYRTECYQSLGRDVSAYTLQDYGRAAKLCSNGDPNFQPWCHIGFVKNVVDVTADYTKGLDYCRTLEAVPNKKACYRAVGEEVASLTADDAERDAACGEAEWAYRVSCGEGAGVRRYRQESASQ